MELNDLLANTYPEHEQITVKAIRKSVASQGSKGVIIATHSVWALLIVNKRGCSYIGVTAYHKASNG